MKPVILRPARLADMPFIRIFHAEQNERDGTTYPLPRMFNQDGTTTAQVPVVLVGCEEGSDVPVQAIWVERRAELMFAGCDPKATAFARRDIEGLATLLNWFGYKGLHCEVPVALAEAIAKPLNKAGFTQTDDRLAHFFREV
jgi:hypothetical protein